MATTEASSAYPQPVGDGREARPGPLLPAPRTPSTPALAWYALHLFAHREFKVRGELDRLRFDCFLPAVTERREWSDREKSLERPLFPGYIFVRLKPSEFERVSRIAGVTSILGNPDPEAIPEAQIEDVRRVIATGAAAPCPYVAGAAVSVERGPLAGISGIVQRAEAGRTRLVVAIELMRRAVELEIDAADLAAA